jgi:hypothetical protein
MCVMMSTPLPWAIASTPVSCSGAPREGRLAGRNGLHDRANPAMVEQEVASLMKALS